MFSRRQINRILNRNYRIKIMIQTEKINGQQWIYPSDLYEWTIEELIKGTFKSFMENETLENLKGVEWIKDEFKTLNGLELTSMYNSLLKGMQDGSMPPELMSWSAMYCNFTKKGLNTEEMRNTINNSPALIKEIEAMGSRVTI